MLLPAYFNKNSLNLGLFNLFKGIFSESQVVLHKSWLKEFFFESHRSTN